MAKPHNPAGNAGKGRVKGSQNKMTILAREAIQTAFDELGGVPALVDWAKRSDEHRKVFYSQIWTKVLPLQIDAKLATVTPEDLAWLGDGG
jgi:hypothetical protein